MEPQSFYQRHSFTIIFVVVFLLAFIGMGAKRTLQSNSNNVADWLPDSFAETQEYKWFIRHFPYESFIVASWKGCTLDDPRLEMLAQKLVPRQTIDNMDEWEDQDFVLSAELKLAQDALSDLMPDSVFVNPSADVKALESASEFEKLTDKQKNVPPDADSSKTDDQNEKKLQQIELEAQYYFKSVLTGERIVRLMQKQYPNMKLEEILDRLDGVLIGPKPEDQLKLNSTAHSESVSDADDFHRNTALIVTLTPNAKGKELQRVVNLLKEFARECNIEPRVPEDNRSIAQKVLGALIDTGKEMVYGRTPSTDGIILGGPPIDNIAIDYEGTRTLYRLAGICAIIGLTIAFLCLRNFLLTLIVFWISILAAGVSLALVSFTGTHCDAILLSMPALVYVLTMAGAVHMVNYYFDAVEEHGFDRAPERMLASAWYPCVISSTTTALGLFSLYTSHLIPIIKFGVFSAIGVIAALPLLFLYYPAILYFYPPKNIVHRLEKKRADGEERDHIFHIFWRMFGGVIVKHHNLVAVLCVIAMVYFAFGFTQIKTSVKMMRFFSPDAEIIAHYAWLEKQLGPLVPMEVVIKFDNEKCDLNSFERMQFVNTASQDIREKLSGQVGGLMSAATFMPNLKLNLHRKAGPRASAIIYEGARQIDAARSKSLKDYVMVEKVSFDRNTLKTAEEEKAFNARLDQIGITDLQASLLTVAGINTIDKLLYDTDNIVIPGFTADQLDEIRQKAQDWQNKHGKDFWRISLRVWALQKEGQNDIDYAIFVGDVKNVVNPLIERKIEEDSMLKDQDAVSAVYTGMVPVVYKTQHELLYGLAESFFWSFVSIAVVLMFVLKNAMAGFLAMLPNVFPTILIFGIIGHTGTLVDVGMMMSASVALGIAVDDTIHYLTWFRKGIDMGLDAKKAAMFAYEKCATAMTETTVIAGFGLSAFMFSTFTPTQMFGMMMLSILFAALIGDLIFLPAILTGPAGRFFYTKKKKENPNENNSNFQNKFDESGDGKNPNAIINADSINSNNERAEESDSENDQKRDSDRYLGKCHIKDYNE